MRVAVGKNARHWAFWGFIWAMVFVGMLLTEQGIALLGEDNEAAMGVLGLLFMSLVLAWGMRLIMTREGYTYAVRLIMTVVFCVVVLPLLGTAVRLLGMTF